MIQVKRRKEKAFSSFFCKKDSGLAEWFIPLRKKPIHIS